MKKNIRKSIFVLNLIGLSIACAVFYILMAQVKWEKEYDTFHKDGERIYQITRESDFAPHNIPFPLFEQVRTFSPYVETAGIKTEVRKGDIQKEDMPEEKIEAQFCYINKGYTEIFNFNMIEGSTESLSDPSYAILPLGLAEKIFGKQESYVGKSFGNGGWFLKVGGVYKEFPSNSMLEDLVYQIPPEDKFNWYLSRYQDYNYEGYVKLSPQADYQTVFKEYRYHNKFTGEKEMPIYLQPLKELYYRDTGDKQITLTLIVIACMILIIASVNYFRQCPRFCVNEKTGFRYIFPYI